ncbi:hypothetical protein J6590_038948 [Homalodisca vitripennis]|nr:hypothetical protein J6590_090357 [Homalodisca vitripennis]KAG8292471.1 hypothetical protein J6590_038948 [Homalodisca vitripennis]
MTAVQSVLLYGVNVGADELINEVYRMRLGLVQRQAKQHSDGLVGRWNHHCPALIRVVRGGRRSNRDVVKTALLRRRLRLGFLSGHGYFQGYRTASIARRWKHIYIRSSPICILSLDTVWQVMLVGQEHCACLSYFIQDILRAKNWIVTRSRPQFFLGQIGVIPVGLR